MKYGYWIAIGLALLIGCGGGGGSSAGTAPPPVAPSITSQPASQSVTAGNPVTFTVGASGTAPLNYQWRKGGVPINGAGNAAFNLIATTLSDAGVYDVLVSNAAGSATSAPATLTVHSPIVAPVITQQPVDLVAFLNVPATFQVGATGEALTYQWKKGGTPISGAVEASYTLALPSTSNAGSYLCTVSNPGGSVDSTPATLTVKGPSDPPLITQQPVSRSAFVGDQMTWTLKWLGGAAYPARVSWYRNGVKIGDTQSENYTYTVVAGDEPTTQWYATVLNNATFTGVQSNTVTLTATQAPVDFTITKVILTQGAQLDDSSMPLIENRDLPILVWASSGVRTNDAFHASVYVYDQTMAQVFHGSRADYSGMGNPAQVNPQVPGEVTVPASFVKNGYTYKIVVNEDNATPEANHDNNSLTLKPTLWAALAKPMRLKLVPIVQAVGTGVTDEVGTRASVLERYPLSDLTVTTTTPLTVSNPSDMGIVLTGLKVKRLGRRWMVTKAAREFVTFQQGASDA